MIFEIDKQFLLSFQTHSKSADFFESVIFPLIKQQENENVLLFQGRPRLSLVYALTYTKSYFLAFQRYDLKLHIISVHNKDYSMDRLVDGRLNVYAQVHLKIHLSTNTLITPTQWKNILKVVF